MPVPERVTASVRPEIFEDLRKSVERNGVSQTYIINQAIKLYEFVDSEIAAGADMILRRDGVEKLIELF
jgi:hypothetical protein